MKKLACIIIIGLVGAFFANGNPDLKSINQYIKELSKTAIENADQINFSQSPQNDAKLYPRSGIEQLLKKTDFIKTFLTSKNSHKNTIQTKDTLFIGMKVNDSLVITGDWTYNGTIVIVLNGKLIFNSANATILGDIIMMHDGALEVKDSKIYLPQQYFYQRSIMGVGNSQFIAENSSFDYSGLSHNLILMDSAKFDFNNITVNGFTTTGMYNKASFIINKINEAGEFVIMDSTSLSINNSKTALIWHVIPQNGKMEIIFPKGESLLSSYVCNNSIQGISGIYYDVKIQNTSNVMWGLMPKSGSDVKIKDSHIRAIGLWYIKNEMDSVNSIVNNSLYQNFSLPGSNRNLSLINTLVDTWSIYCFNNSDLILNSSIVGEIGCMGKSKAIASKTFCDGSGGYIFANDTSMIIYGFGGTSSSIRSTGNSIFLFGYSSLNMGQADAFGNSVMLIVQSVLSVDPIAHDASSLWIAKIEQPLIKTVESYIPVIGTAAIKEGPDGNPIKFSHYSLYYKTNNDPIWHSITENNTNLKQNDTLAIWNTKSLKPDNYNVKLVLYSNFKDSVEAIRSISLLPNYTNIIEDKGYETNVQPNPTNGIINVIFSLVKPGLVNYTLYDLTGKLVSKLKNQYYSEGQINERIDIGLVKSGTYILKVESSELSQSFKIIIN